VTATSTVLATLGGLNRLGLGAVTVRRTVYGTAASASISTSSEGSIRVCGPAGLGPASSCWCP